MPARGVAFLPRLTAARPAARKAVAAAAAAPAASGQQQQQPQSDYRKRERKDVRVLVVGATGYIGKFVVKELIKRGYNVVAFSREKSGIGGKASMDDTRKVGRGVRGLGAAAEPQARRGG